ncbi:MAG: hypothetical protein WBK91_07085 [Alphaproteobacteria bacterium]
MPDFLHVALIGAIAAVAHYFPYHLLMFSYAVLGPIHYFTQMTWLHDRSYFVAGRWFVPLFVLLTLGVLLSGNHAIAGLILMTAFLIAAGAVITEDWRWRAAIVIAGFLVILLVGHGEAVLAIAMILPTIAHVFLFTAILLWNSAAQERNLGKFLAFAALILGAGSFFLPLNEMAAQDLTITKFFKPTVDYLQLTFGLTDGAQAKLFGLLGFTFTYHYLYWLDKVALIKIQHIPRHRLAGIGLFYLIALASYAYDYDVGFYLLAFPSVLHVLLEFPLNVRSLFWLRRPVPGGVDAFLQRKS